MTATSSGRFPPLDRRAETDASWAATLDTLRAPRKTNEKLAEWRREAPIRPIVFQDAGVLSDDTVHLHLEQRVAQRLLARFRSQGFIHHDLSRACLAQTADSVPRVILLGRLSLYGRNAERLHEEIVPLAARWVEPSRRQTPLRAYAREAETRTLDLLEASLGRGGHEPNESVRSKILAAAARDIEELRPQLEPRAEELAEVAIDRGFASEASGKSTTCARSSSASGSEWPRSSRSRRTSPLQLRLGFGRGGEDASAKPTCVPGAFGWSSSTVTSTRSRNVSVTSTRSAPGGWSQSGSSISGRTRTDGHTRPTDRSASRMDRIRPADGPRRFRACSRACRAPSWIETMRRVSASSGESVEQREFALR